MIHYAMKTDETNALFVWKLSALWVFGCPFCCEGCMSAYTKSIQNDRTACASELAQEFIRARNSKGLLISGGEPFLQANELFRLVRAIRKERKEYPIIVYTGYEFEKLKKMAATQKKIADFLSVIDVLIDGRYMDSLNDDKRRFIGSSNQRVINLSGYFSDEFLAHVYDEGERMIEYREDFDTVKIIGVPTRKQLQELNELIGNLEDT